MPKKYSSWADSSRHLTSLRQQRRELKIAAIILKTSSKIDLYPAEWHHQLKEFHPSKRHKNGTVQNLYLLKNFKVSL